MRNVSNGICTFIVVSCVEKISGYNLKSCEIKFVKIICVMIAFKISVVFLSIELLVVSYVEILHEIL